MLLYLEGLSAANIGDLCGLSPGAVATKVHRLKAVLAQQFKRKAPMSGEPSDFDPRTVWLTQATEDEPMTVAQIHEKARLFHARIRRRNVAEYVACVVVIAGFTPVLVQRESWMMQAGALLIMAATLFVAWRLHRRASAQRAPSGGDALVTAYRQELTRQRDALRSMGRWYLAPFAPGMALVVLGRWFQSHAPDRTVALDHLIIALAATFAALVLFGVWLRNQRGADRLQKLIDEL